MITTGRRHCFTVLLLTVFAQAYTQDTRTFNQNASRSNHTRSSFSEDEWVFGLSGGMSFGFKNNERSLFRGNSLATKISGDYYFGKIGLGFASGIAAGTISKSAVNEFLVERKLQQGQISKSNPSNSYFVAGPSIRMGERVIVSAGLKAGLFMNDPGGISIVQPGIDRPAYSFDGGEKKLFPGFTGDIRLSYPINSSTGFFVNADYLQSKASVRLYDPQRGIDIPVVQDRNVKLVTVGLGITRSFGGRAAERDAAINGKKHIANTQWSERTIGPGVQQHAINTKGTGATNGRMMNDQNCGPVTQKTTLPDGSVEEKTFACPQDAANYARATEDMEPKRIVHRDIAARNIISGRLAWISPSNGSSGIITNNNIKAQSKQTQGSSFGEKVKMGIRESATGNDKKLKEYGLIFADQGNVSYTSSLGAVNDNPLYSNTTPVNNPLYEGGVKSGVNPMSERKMSSGNVNPMFEDKGNNGTKPSQNGSMNTNEGDNGLAGIDVLLIDEASNAIVAKTSTGSTGEFFFANVPDGDYKVKLNGAVTRKKGYDLHASSKIDLLGIVEQGDEQLELLLNTEGPDEGMEQRAGISTSRSNIRTRSLSVINADLDGDGQYESTKVLMELTDGSTRDVTSSARINSAAAIKKVTVRGWDPGKKMVSTDNTKDEYTITINESGEASLGIQEPNGTKSEETVYANTNQHSNVMQVTAMVEDQKIKTKSNIKNDRLANPNNGDNTGEPLPLEDQKIKTKSNIKNDRLSNPNAGGNTGGPQPLEDQKIKTKSNIKNDRLSNPNVGENQIGEPEPLEDQKIKTKSNIKNDRMANMTHSDEYKPQGINGYRKLLSSSRGDINEDGEPELLLGGAIPGGSVVSAAAMRPGQPIGGIVVKGGKNPGGSMRTVPTNERGEFEFPGLDAGDYLFMIEETVVISDETSISVQARKGWDGTVKGGSLMKTKHDTSKNSVNNIR